MEGEGVGQTSYNQLSIDEKAYDKAISARSIRCTKDPDGSHDPVENQRARWCFKLHILLGEELVERDDALAGDLLLDWFSHKASELFSRILYGESRLTLG